MRVVCAVALLAVLPACDRVFGLSETTVIHADDTGDDDAGPGSDASECVGAFCFEVVAPDQGGATEIVSDPAGELLAWNPQGSTSSGTIVGCSAASCVPLKIVPPGEDHPHALLHDGTYVFWASNGEIHKAAVEEGFPAVVYAPPSSPSMGAVASFVFYGDCWILIQGAIFHGVYDETLRTCDSVAGVHNLHDGHIVPSGDVTSQLSLLVDADNTTFPLAGTTMGAYTYDAGSDIRDVYTGLTSAEHIASTKKWIAGIVPGSAAVRGVPVGDSEAETVSFDLQDNAIGIKANFEGDIFVATETGAIIRIATKDAFGPPVSIVSGIPSLRDFAFDHAGNIFAISGENIIRIDAQ